MPLIGAFSWQICFLCATAALVSSTEVIDVSADHISYVVTNLSPFTEYTFGVSAFTTVGEGPLAQISEKTREQGNHGNPSGLTITLL